MVVSLDINNTKKKKKKKKKKKTIRTSMNMKTSIKVSQSAMNI